MQYLEKNFEHFDSLKEIGQNLKLCQTQSAESYNKKDQISMI